MENTIQPAPSQEYQQSLSPQEALNLLKEGNQRFLNQAPLQKDHLGDVRTTAGGQFPWASLLGCIDSRVVPEMIFDQGVGDIFDCRVAGNIVNEDVLGSLEFATAVAGSKVIVVMGHTKCGAVKGACSGVEMGNLTALLSKVGPAIEKVRSNGMEVSADHPESFGHVEVENVHHSVNELRNKSAILKELEDKGDILIIGAMYDVGTGTVTFYE